jgi:prephenate dehydrogenase
VRELLGDGVVLDADGQQAPLHSGDVAVITPHLEQASAIAARLADVAGILIGTANQPQGLEREAVIVIHPLAGTAKHRLSRSTWADRVSHSHITARTPR